MRSACSEGIRKARCNPISQRLKGLTIGALTLTPEFDPDETDYIVTTTNATNKVSATPESADATVVITVNDTEIESGDVVTWDSGDNEVVVEVTGDDGTTTYTVTVTAE